MFGAIVFTFFGFNIAHFVHIVITSAVAHLPFCLLAIDGVMRARSLRGIALCGLALALLTTSLLVVSAHPQTVWICGLIELAYVLFLLLGRMLFFLAGPRFWFLAQGLGILAGAIQIIPTWEVMQAFVPGQSFEGVRGFFHSMPPGNVVQTLSLLISTGMARRVPGPAGNDGVHLGLERIWIV